MIWTEHLELSIAIQILPSLTMSDFSDEEDYRLARAQVDAGRKISWWKVWRGMPFSGKSQRQLQIRLKTLKRTYGTNLNQFPKCFVNDQVSRPPPAARTTKAYPVDAIVNVHQAISMMFASVPRQQLRDPQHSPDCHAGEGTPAGVSAVLAALPPLKPTDTFVDVGSDIGNVVA